MVNMMARNPREGDSLFAQLFNVWLWHQELAVAHRNRIRYLTERLVLAAAAAARQSRVARVCSLGCGPALEVQRFLTKGSLTQHLAFTLVDFDVETLQHVRAALQKVRSRCHYESIIHTQQRSVQQLLREASRDGRLDPAEPFDLIFCAGLFDYLSDDICRRLVRLLTDSVRPGGMILATNVMPANRNRGSLDLILDWQLTYRDRPQLGALLPPELKEQGVSAQMDLTGTNLFLELRKPDA
jgi:extracellular factor (EF) 3-hydroxypalmitic acid methyl ester biosynthesis protein